MRNFIGNILIGLAEFIKFLRNALILSLLAGIVIGIFMITMIGFFDLMGYVLPNNTEFQMNVLGKPIWDIIAVVIGGGTMWVGISKTIESDKQERKRLENRKYNYNEF
jgi:hypothetical protein